jgi:hypothetical protein
MGGTVAFAEIFVVRLYRRRAGTPDGFAGVVDMIGAGARRGFGTFDELLAILRETDQTRGNPKLSLVLGQSTVHQSKKEVP